MIIYRTSLLLFSCLIGNCIYNTNKLHIHLVLYGLLLHTLNSVAHKNLPGSFPHQLIPLLWHDKLHGFFISWNIFFALFTKSVKTRWGLKCVPNIVNHLNKSAFTTPRKPPLPKIIALTVRQAHTLRMFPIWFHIIYKLFLSHCTTHCDQGVLASMYMLLNL